MYGSCRENEGRLLAFKQRVTSKNARKTGLFRAFKSYARPRYSICRQYDCVSSHDMQNSLFKHPFYRSSVKKNHQKEHLSYLPHDPNVLLYKK